MPSDAVRLKQFDLVRFANERDGGPVHRVVSVMRDGMVELHDMGGYFAPYLFAVADDIGGIPGSCPTDHGGRREDCAAWPACACLELRPCPFCGGDAEFGQIGGEGDDAGGQFIQCTDASCAASSALIFPCGDEPKPLLIERWNRRNGIVAPDPRNATIAALRAEVEQLRQQLLSPPTAEEIEAAAKALWRLENPEDGFYSGVAPNDWNRWPESGRGASMAQVEHSKNEYREQAAVAFAARAALKEPK